MSAGRVPLARTCRNRLKSTTSTVADIRALSEPPVTGTCKLADGYIAATVPTAPSWPLPASQIAKKHSQRGLRLLPSALDRLVCFSPRGSKQSPILAPSRQLL